MKKWIEKLKKNGDRVEEWETTTYVPLSRTEQRLIAEIESLTAIVEKKSRVMNCVNNINWGLIESAIHRPEIAEHSGVETELVKLKALQQALQAAKEKE